MKAEFFLIAFCLLFLGVYFTFSMHDDRRNGKGSTNITIGSDGGREEIHYAGPITLNEEETGIKSLAPGSYLRYRKNDKRLEVESSVPGEISYTLYNGDKKVPMDSTGKAFITEAVHEMIAYGFDRDARIDRIYAKGGDSALLSEAKKMKQDDLKNAYYDRLFAADTLAPGRVVGIAKDIDASGDDREKVRFLNRLTPTDLEDRSVLQAYFTVVQHINSDLEKRKSLLHLIDQKTLSGEMPDQVLNVAGQLAGDQDKEPVYQQLIRDGRLTEVQWLHLVRQLGQINNDRKKADLLVETAQRMPVTDTLKSTYLKVAKTITADADYGKALRPIE